MSSEIPSIPEVNEIVAAFRNDFDRIQRGGELPRLEFEEDVSFPELQSIRLIQELRRGIEATQEQARKERNQELQARVESRLQSFERRIEGLDTSEKERRQEVTAASEGKFVITGRVLDAETREALPGIRVQAMERDPENDDLLGEVRTDREGFYRLEYTEDSFNAAQDEEPETYIRVLDEDGNALFTSDQSYRHKAGEVEVIDAAIEGNKVPESLEVGTQLREGKAAELNDLRRRKENLRNRVRLRVDPLSILPSEE